jgi:hypothetical protein
MERKTKRELADFIASRIGLGGRTVTVFSSPELGWDATLITAPPQSFRAATIVKKIAAEPRAKYDLLD